MSSTTEDLTRPSAHLDSAHVSPIHGALGELPRRDWWRSLGEAFLIGRDLVFLAWTLLVLAFWLAIIAGLLL